MDQPPRLAGSARLHGRALVLLIPLLAATACVAERRPVDGAPHSAATEVTARAPADAPARQPAPEPLLDPPITAVAADEPDMPEGVFHRVEPGQTLWRIARAYGVDLQELAEVNNVEDPRALEAGKMLYVPGAQTPIEVAPYPAPLPSARGSLDAPGERRPESSGAGFVWPVAGGGVLSPFGVPRRNHRHAGIDIAGNSGQDVVAAAGGEVVYSGKSPGGYGNLVILDHGNGLETLYAHNSKLLVEVGDEVDRGQVVALVGRTGNATTEHCHFEVRQEKVAVDPGRYFAPEATAALRADPRAPKSGAPGTVAGRAEKR